MAASDTAEGGQGTFDSEHYLGCAHGILISDTLLNRFFLAAKPLLCLATDRDGQQLHFPAAKYNEVLPGVELRRLEVDGMLSGRRGDRLWTLRPALYLADLRRCQAPAWVPPSQRSAWQLCSGEGSAWDDQVAQALARNCGASGDGQLRVQRISDPAHPCVGGHGVVAGRDLAAGSCLLACYGGVMLTEQHYDKFMLHAGDFAFTYVYETLVMGDAVPALVPATWHVPKRSSAAEQTQLQRKAGCPLFRMCLDGSTFRNVLGLVNDPKGMVGSDGQRVEPNVEAGGAFVAGLPLLLYSPKRDIRAGEELLISYGTTYWRRFEQVVQASALKEQLKQQRRDMQAQHALGFQTLTAARSLKRREADLKAQISRQQRILAAEQQRERDRSRLEGSSVVATSSDAQRADSLRKGLQAAQRAHMSRAREAQEVEEHLEQLRRQTQLEVEARKYSVRRKRHLGEDDDAPHAGAGGQTLDITGSDAQEALKYRVMYKCSCCATGSVMRATNKARHTQECAAQLNAAGHRGGHWTGGLAFEPCPWCSTGVEWHCLHPFESLLNHALYCARAPETWCAAATAKSIGLFPRAAGAAAPLPLTPELDPRIEEELMASITARCITAPMEHLFRGEVAERQAMEPVRMAAAQPGHVNGLAHVHAGYVYLDHTPSGKSKGAGAGGWPHNIAGQQHFQWGWPAGLDRFAHRTSGPPVHSAPAPLPAPVPPRDMGFDEHSFDFAGEAAALPSSTVVPPPVHPRPAPPPQRRAPHPAAAGQAAWQQLAPQGHNEAHVGRRKKKKKRVIRAKSEAEHQAKLAANRAARR